MNIFILDQNPKLCAQYHCDSHVVKMMLESAQMLCTAVRLSGIDQGYRATHINHPCNKWARESLDNWLWLRQLQYELNTEWAYRYDHGAKLSRSTHTVMDLPVPDIPAMGRTPFALAMPDMYISPTRDAVSSYRQYYISAKRHLFAWTKRGIPEWLY